MDNRNLDGYLWYLNDGYWKRTETVDGKRKCVSQHVYIYEQVNGKVPAGYDIHHVNFDKSDNRLENLVCLTHAEHLSLHKIGNNNFIGKSHSDKSKIKMAKEKHIAGLISTNSSGFKGVSFHKSTNKYMSYIWIDKKLKYLGRFATAESAARAYDEAAKNLWGDACFLNIPTR